MNAAGPPLPLGNAQPASTVPTFENSVRQFDLALTPATSGRRGSVFIFGSRPSTRARRVAGRCPLTLAGTQRLCDGTL
jgi:hypothetical protein